MMTITIISTVCHLVTLLLSLWVKVSTSPWSPASTSLLARALATVICLHIYCLHIYISTVYSHLSQGPHCVTVEVIMLHSLVLSDLPAACI